MDIETLVEQVRNSVLDGQALAAMVAEGRISKGERRKITKLAAMPKKELSERQKLRLAVKEKKAQPKLSKEDRRRKYLLDKMEEDRDKKRGEFTVCLGCRQEGHVLKYCPQVKATNSPLQICFNCGSNEHNLHLCPKPRVGTFLPFSTCFICDEKGHLSRDCPKNSRGLYPDGGCCHICKQATHLVKDCPQKPSDGEKSHRKAPSEGRIKATEDDFSAGHGAGAAAEKRLGSGEDLGYNLEDVVGEDDEETDRKSKKKSKKRKTDA